MWDLQVVTVMSDGWLRSIWLGGKQPLSHVASPEPFVLTTVEPCARAR